MQTSVTTTATTTATTTTTDTNTTTISTTTTTTTTATHMVITNDDGYYNISITMYMTLNYISTRSSSIITSITTGITPLNDTLYNIFIYNASTSYIYIRYNKYKCTIYGNSLCT